MAGNMEKMGGGKYSGIGQTSAKHTSVSGSPNVGKLRTTGKQVSAIGGHVAGNKLGNATPKKKA